MRMDQFKGLNQWARHKVRRTKLVREVGKEIRARGKEVPFDRVRRVACVESTVYSKVRARYKPFAGDLHRYTLASGAVLEEYVQAVMESGGPCYFIALRDEHGEPVSQSLWTREQLARA
jgi:hypothetical protein